MARPWIRLYTDIPYSAKVQRLPDHLFRFLVNCWALTGASKDDCVPDLSDLCFALRIDPGICQAYLDHLIDQNLLTRRQGSGKIVPKNWDDRQFLSESSTDRVRKFREKLKKSKVKRDETVSVTVQDSDTDTETDQTQNGATRVRPEFDDQWQTFRRLYADSGKSLIEEDFTKAHLVWRVLDFAQRTLAIANITARVQAGEWNEPRFIPKPERYLEGGEYKRKVVPMRPKKQGGLALTDEDIAAL